MLECYNFEECEYNAQPKCCLPNGMECPHGVKAHKPTNADHEKLIERLKNAAGGPEDIKMCQDAATALSTLQAELEQAGAEIARLKHYEDKCHDCPIVCAKTEIIKAHEELEAIQAELEQVKWEKDAAVNDLQCIKSCAVCKHCDSLQTPIPEICKKCSHGENWDWRGPKED